MRYRLAWISGTALTLSACAAGPDYRAPQTGALGVPAAYSAGDGAALSEAELGQWWTRLNDPTLSALIDQAVANNLDVVQAQARLRQARESLIQSNASLLPQLSGSATGGRNYSSQDAGGRLDANGNPIGGGGATGRAAIRPAPTPAGNSTCSANCGAGAKRRALIWKRRALTSPPCA